MSLLDDLRAIDFSAVVQARGNISVAVQDPELQSILSGGPAQAALAGLGQSIQDLRGNFSSPEAILRPVIDAIGGLGANLSTDDLPIDRYVSAVGEGVQVVLRIIEGLDSDPNNVGAFLGGSLSGQIDSLSRFISSYAQVGTPELGRLRTTLERIDRGFSGAPVEMADLALDVLLPFPRTALVEIRTNLDGILQVAGGIQFPEGRFRGLEAALDAVNAAALTGDRAALDRALRELAQVRDNTLAVIQGDLLGVFEQIGRMRLDLALEPMVRAADALRVAQVGVLDLLESIRGQLAFVRTQIEDADPAQAGAFFDRMVEFLQEQAETLVVAPIDAAVVRLEEFIRGLFRRLPLRSIRAEVTRFLHQIAEAIRGLGIEAAVQAVRDTLAEVRDTVSSGNLTAEVQQVLNRARQTITRVLGGITGALGQITDRINAVAAEAQAVLQRASDALAAFAQAIRDLTAAIDQLGIDAAADQVVDTLRTLREKAEQLLSVAPLPEPMRPVVEQLISTLEGVDFDVVFRPLREAVSQIEIPNEVRTTITDTLVEIRDAIQNLIPDELIASIEAEVNEALDVIRNFNPASLLPDVTSFLNEAAAFVERLDPRQAVAGLNEPFQAVLDGIDAVHPRRLLAPVIEAYDSVLARVQLPGPDLAMRRFSDLINAAGEATAQAVTAPVRQLTAPAGAPSGAAPSPGPTPAVSPTPGPGTPLPETFRPGDVVRLFGYLPARVREGLQALDAGPAGDVLRRIDALTSGLARDLRRLQHELRQIEVRLRAALDAALAPIGQRQLNAQANIRARFSGGGVQVEAAVTAVAQAGPGAMRLALAETMGLVRTRVAGAVMGAGGNVAATLERTATALESTRLARITGGLDAFLAALDPEPLATDLDEFVRVVLQRAPQLLAGFEAQLTAAVQRIAGIIQQLNPAVQAQKFVRILNVLKEELDVLNPSVLADELGEIHAAIRRVVAAFDPAAIANDLFAIVQETANSIRALDPATLLGDLSFLDNILDEVEAAIPTQALQGVGESLAEVGTRLVELDPNGLLDAIENLGPRIIDQVEDALDKIRDEIVALLESIRYANANASVSVSASVGVG